jgi:hypothetical protein
MMEGSVPTTNGSGSGRPRNSRIWIRNTAYREMVGKVAEVTYYLILHQASVASKWLEFDAISRNKIGSYEKWQCPKKNHVDS